MMRKFIILFLLFNVKAFFVFSQIVDDSTNVKFFFTIGTDLAKKYGENVYFFELSGGFDIQGIEIEGFGKSMLSGLTYKDDSLEKNMDLTYGGIMINYFPWYDKVISPFGGIGIGVGNVSLSDVMNLGGNSYVKRFASDDLTFVMFQAGVDIRSFNWLYIGLSIKYEEAYGLQLYQLNNKDFTGFAGSFAIKLKF